MRNRNLWGAIASSAVACVAVAAIAAVSPSQGASAQRRDARAAYLQPFPRTAIAGAYTMTPYEEYHYAVPYATAAVQYAAYRVLERYGRTQSPMEICDISTINGTTPEGRHPGSAHHGGINFDITYYEKHPLRDHIVCPSRADNHCTGPAEDLDAERQAYFFAVLAELDLVYDRGLIQRMAVDGRVRQAVLPALDRLGSSGEFKAATVSRARELVYGELTDQGTGWFRYHHNHTHLRFYWDESRADRLHAAITAGIGRVMARLNGEERVATSSRPAAAPSKETAPPSLALAAIAVSEPAQVKQIRTELGRLNERKNPLLLEIGTKVHAAYSAGGTAVFVEAMCREVARIEGDIKLKQAEIERIQQAAAALPVKEVPGGGEPPVTPAVEEPEAEPDDQMPM